VLNPKAIGAVGKVEVNPPTPQGGLFRGSPPGRGWGWVKTGTDCNRVLLQQDELGEAKSAPAEYVYSQHQV